MRWNVLGGVVFSLLLMSACPGPTPEPPEGVDAGQQVFDAGHQVADAGALPDAGSGAEDGGMAPLTPVFFSDWRTMALGTDNALVLDGQKWDLIGGNGRGEIIEAPAGFPTARALRVVYRNNGFVLLRKSGLPVPDIGGTRNYRWYYRHDQPDWPTDNTQHPIQDGNAQGDISWSFNTTTLSDTTWRNYFGVQVNLGENTWEMGRWYGPTLTIGTVYRYELQVHRTADTTFQLHARIHGADGQLLYGDADFNNQHQGGNLTLADGPTLTFSQNTTRPYYNADTLNGMNAGCNGISGVTQDEFPYSVQAGFAVVDGLAPGEFIGPYGAVVGEVP